MRAQARRFDLGGYEVFDIDLANDGSCVALVGTPNVEVVAAGREPLVYRRPEPGSLRVVGFGADTWQLPLGGVLGDVDFVRAVGNERVLLVRVWPSSDEPINALLVGRSGEVEAAFHVGCGIEDVLVSPTEIVVTYFDEGVFSLDPLCQSGLNVFDFAGRLVLDADAAGFVDDLQIADCYCAAWASERRVVFCAYPDFRYASIDLRSGECRAWVTPRKLHGASGLSVVETDDGDAVFFAFWRNSRIFRWRPGGSRVKRVGKHAGKLRGLPGGRFLAPQRDGYTLIDLRD
jgi:hypothetical protein